MHPGADLLVILVRGVSVWPMTRDSLRDPSNGAADQQSPSLNVFD
jgi:hypothetical protein